jgi:hypothetical protein
MTESIRSSIQDLRCQSFLQAQRPFDAAENMRLIRFGDLNRIFAVMNVRVSINQISAMTERGVKNFSGAVIFAPRNRIISGRTGFRMFVEDEQVVDFRRAMIFELIDFFLLNRPDFRQRCGCRILRILVQAIHADLPAMVRKPVVVVTTKSLFGVWLA